MKGLCFFTENPVPKKDLFPVLHAIVRRFELPGMFDKDFVEFLITYSGSINLNLNSKRIELTTDEHESIAHFRKHIPGSSTEWFFKEPDGEVSQLCLITSIADFHIPVYAFKSFEEILKQLIYIGGLDLDDAHAFCIAETESDQRGLHMSILKEDFGAIYYIQDGEDEPLPFGRHKVANNFTDLINSLKLCIATSSKPYPLTIKEIGHCIDN